MRAEGTLGLLMIPAVLVFVVFALWWHYHTSSSRLQAWADENAFTILRKEYRNFLRGPFFWTTSKGQTVYRVTVRDKAGHIQEGWVRCGSWWLGLLSPQVDVRWDGPDSPPKAPMKDQWDEF